MKKLIYALLFTTGFNFTVNAEEKKLPKLTASHSAVVVELFTSEGCSSCPPADKLLTELSKAGAIEGVDVIPLAQHVDYWNRLGWTDPFSSAKFSQRQQEYAQSFRSDQIYTPQMVVDGTVQFVGSDRDRAIASIRNAAGQPKGAITLHVTAPKAGELKLSVGMTITGLPALTPGDEAEVLIAITEDNLKSDVARGENAGHKLAQTGVVREWQTAGKLSPDRKPVSDQTAQITLNENWKRENLKVVVIVQERTSRRILAAASHKINEP